MILEEIRYVLEDIERLEQAIVDRLVEEPTYVQIRDRLNCQHEVAQLLEHIQTQSAEALKLFSAAQGPRSDEVRLVSGGCHDSGDDADPLAFFYQQCDAALAYHARYPNEPIDQPELRYQSRQKQLQQQRVHRQRAAAAAAAASVAAVVGGGDVGAPGYDPAAAAAAAASAFGADDAQLDVVQPTLVDTMFSGEEGFGRYFDLNANYEAYVNLPHVKRLTYLQYLEVFDNFAPPTATGGGSGPKRGDKLTEAYFQYVGDLATYLERFMRKTRPLEPLEKVLAGFDDDFAALWDQGAVPNWPDEVNAKAAAAKARLDKTGAPTLSTPDAVWCVDCEKEFKNQNVYQGHLSGRKHVRAAEQRTAATAGGDAAAAAAYRLKERAVAAREYRVQRLVAAMSTEKEDTRVNVERRQGMTERERQQELENMYNMTMQQVAETNEGEDEDDDDDKIRNPLKLPLSWDGKPIPFWLYRLHGLGVEFTCEICGKYTYMGRRAFEKHFSESRHVHGLRCLGINDPALFRDITSIEDALRLWDKIQREQRKATTDESAVVQMEDAEGHVMPEKVYYDLQKQGLL